VPRILRLYAAPDDPDPTGAIEFLLGVHGLPGKVAFTFVEQGDGEIEVTVHGAADTASWERVVQVFGYRHGDQLFSTDGSTTDDIVRPRLADRKLVVVDWLTGGLMADRLTAAGVVFDALDPGAILTQVSLEVIAAYRAVSPEVTEHMARLALGALGSAPGLATAIAIAGVGAGGAGADDTPTRTVYVSAVGSNGVTLTYEVDLNGGAEELLGRTVTLAMHVLRALHGPERLRVRSPVQI
jgi:nicotinamide mononucleotide (NMN) deamidase PncC